MNSVRNDQQTRIENIRQAWALLMPHRDALSADHWRTQIERCGYDVVERLTRKAIASRTGVSSTDAEPLLAHARRAVAETDSFSFGRESRYSAEHLDAAFDISEMWCELTGETPEVEITDQFATYVLTGPNHLKLFRFVLLESAQLKWAGERERAVFIAATLKGFGANVPDFDAAGETAAQYLPEQDVAA